MGLRRSDLTSESRQNKNAGNSGDLLKHSAYLALAHELVRRSPWRDELRVLEAHAGKGVYAATSSHLRTARSLPGYGESPLGRAQADAFADPPAGLGQITGLAEDELPYAGSAVLHALELAGVPRRTLILMDHDLEVRETLSRVFEEPALRPAASGLELVDPGERSEPSVLQSLEDGRYLPTYVLHFDPFAFVMKPNGEVRSTYGRLIALCDDEVRQGQLGAASLFITWGSNSRAALDDLDGAGYRGGLDGGYRDLIEGVDHSRRIVLTWCWEMYFSLLLVVPSELRADLATRLRDYVAPFRSRLSRLTIQ